MGAKAFALGAVTLIAAALAWNAGEMHRENCQRDDRTGCSVLPWENGHRAPARSASPSVEDLTGVTVECILNHTPCP